MHVLLIHQVFAGPDDPGGTRHYELGRHLVERGHRFTVIRSAVNYLTATPAEPPTAALPPGMRIVSVAGPRDIHRSYRARIRAFLIFAVGAARAVRGLTEVD